MKEYTQDEILAMLNFKKEDIEYLQEAFIFPIEDGLIPITIQTGIYDYDFDIDDLESLSHKNLIDHKDFIDIEFNSSTGRISYYFDIPVNN